MIFSNLYKKDSYTIPESYVINSIYEYDISKANINILYEKGIIDDNQYNTLYNSDKKSREISVGMMQKNVSVARALSQGFCEFRRRLFESNGIQDNEIVSIKKDAVFVTRPLINTVFGRVEFKEKNIFNMMIKLDRLEIYYGVNSVTREHVIDIKGIKDEKIDKYENYFFNILINVFCLLVSHLYVQALDLINKYIQSYVNLELDVTAYREFNNVYMYRIKNSLYMSECVLDMHKNCLDISCNLNLLLQLKMLVINMYYG